MVKLNEIFNKLFITCFLIFLGYCLGKIENREITANASYPSIVFHQK